MKEERKSIFIDNLKASGGIICVACESTGINRSTYYKWREADCNFAAAVDEVMEAQVDFVESKLMELINAHDTTATIFYLKTKGKKRGWTEKQLTEPPAAAPNPAETTPAQIEMSADEAIEKKKVTARRIKNKKDYIVKLLKKEGKYTSELSMQVTITAQLLVRTELLAEELFGDEHNAINVELSREGNERKSISPTEKLYLDFAQQSQKALRALGMNTDSRERKSNNDGLTDFLNAFNDD